MSQVSDVVLANQGFASFRTELNNILGALNTMHVGSSAPASVATGTIWVDNATTNTLKVKINDGSDNIELFSINTSTNAVSSTMSVTGTISETDPNALPLAIALG
jgi:ribosome-associated protein YbcJ (S4-like RNA binding protein)